MEMMFGEVTETANGTASFSAQGRTVLSLRNLRSKYCRIVSVNEFIVGRKHHSYSRKLKEFRP